MFICCHLSSVELTIFHSILRRRMILILLLALTESLSLLMPAAAMANPYPMPEDGSRLIGFQEVYEVLPGDYFHSIARLYNIGLIALMEANPDVDPFLPPLGTKLQIPTRMLLPDVSHQGIVINLPEMRLYYFANDKKNVHVFPVGIGRIDRPTPTMHSKVKRKIENPSWTPTKKIKEDYLAKYGKELPAFMPPGEDNPLGNYALRLAYANDSYLIHGTNKNFGIGMRVSAGCVRMNPADIAWLFEQVEVGEPVTIINEAVKISTEANGENLIEVHSPLSEIDGQKELHHTLSDQMIEFTDRENVDNIKVKNALLKQQGLVVNVSKYYWEREVD